MNLRSFLYRPLTPAELQEVCRCYLGKTPSCVQLLEGGLFNTTYCVEVAGQKTVLRLGPVNRHWLYHLWEEYNLPQESQSTAARVLEELTQLEAVSED